MGTETFMPIEWQPLDGLNTLGICARARYFTRAGTVAQIDQALAWARQRDLPVTLLGGGSNLVLAGDVPGLVVQPALMGRHWEAVSEQGAVLAVGAGENWHEVVLYAARCGYRGIENLALIPGLCGAAPVQNIGAYGVELRDTLVDVEVLDRHTGECAVLDNAACRFGYRDSVFKHEPDRHIILKVRIALSRQSPLSLGYGELTNYFEGQDLQSLTPLQVAEAVMAIRRRKLPDPEVLPNAGSFFKNPVVSESFWEALRARHPALVGHPVSDGVKLAAARLIDELGWKGYRDPRVGVHNHQALVLINHSGGTGADVLALAGRIREDVEQAYGIRLEIEPGVIGTPGGQL